MLNGVSPDKRGRESSTRSVLQWSRSMTAAAWTGVVAMKVKEMWLEQTDKDWDVEVKEKKGL